VVYTAAIHPDNPELVAAKKAGLPIISRAGLLGEIMRNYRNAINISGTHGKTTTTSMIAEILLEADWDPTVTVGGMMRDIGGSIRVGQSEKFIAEACEYPLHLGVTEAGPAFQGTIKSSVAFGALLSEGIGDTIRVSLSAPPVEEVKVGTKLLEFMGLRERKLEIVSCPSCGRAQVDVWTLAEEVETGLKQITAPLRVAVMGCVVNGPGEAREADLGCASGNGKGQIFVRGKVVETVPENRVVETLLEHAQAMADQMRAELGEAALAGTSPSVVTSA